ncbi:hypothetical protein [Microbacterium oleivorans]|uniref:Transporter n=1 Tax=Microbacterium oleivorans TaxID=273677 RepID=A0A177KBK5_9MICO|nr:hypothetical protein [Microbacterium oleivorans]OAH49981.1 hypothetical protein AYL44_10440 [Microbacterium oleivorans]
MVATVLKLRYRALANTLARRPWQLVGFIFGALWAIGALVSIVAGMVALAVFQPLETATVVAVLGGSALLLGWVLGPILLTGMDTSIDARGLAVFPFTRTQTMLALGGTGLTGLPGIATTLAALSTVILWVRWPLAAVVSIPAAALAVITCVLASRLVGELSGGLGGNRRGRELIGTVVLILLVLSGPILTGVLTLLDAGGDLVARLTSAAAVLPWTPIGAAWGVAPALAAGDVLSAVARLGIAVATVGVLWVVWSRVIDAGTDAAPRRARKVAAAGRLGLFGLLPTGGVGATWARSLNGWLRDPRYLRQLLVVPLLPIVFLVTGGTDGFFFGFSPVFAALMLSIAGYTDVSYDGTAYATVLATGVRGVADRAGRTLGAACVGLPLIVLLATVTAVLSDNLATLPITLGASVGIVLVGYGVSAVSSALIISPVAAPGDSPFKSVPGQTFVNGLLAFVVWGVVIALSTPTIAVAAFASTTEDGSWTWVALAVGVVEGVVIAVLGIVVGGRLLDRTGPDLLAKIRALPS